MSKPLELLMKKHFKFPCFGSTLKVCIVLVVLTLATSLACGGGGYYYYYPKPPSDDNKEWIENVNATNDTSGNRLDEPLVINLTGIKDPFEKNVKTAWRGWIPSNETQKEWREWYDKYVEENARNEAAVPGQGSHWPGGPGWPGGPDYDSERGPGSGWPNFPEWAGLGPGNPGTPVPPWAYAPKNIGKPTICYLPPVRGACRDKKKPKPVTRRTYTQCFYKLHPLFHRWGFNPYINECEKYIWSRCGGTRNKFTTKEACEKHCGQPPPPSCSVDSGILAKKFPKIEDLP